MTTRREAAAEAWGSVLRSHAALVPRLDQLLQQAAGLSLAWYDVLLELNAAPDRRLRMSDLGERVVLSRTRVSRVVDELERAGLVTRAANDDDRRSAFAVLTPDGRALLRKAAPIYLDAIESEFAAGSTVADLQTVQRVLETVVSRTSSGASHAR